MDFDLVILSDWSMRKWSEYIYDILRNRIGLDATYHNEEKDWICVCCEYFHVCFDEQEEGALLNMTIGLVKEDFDFEITVSISIQMFAKNFDKGVEVLFKMINQIIKDGVGNFMLLGDFTEIILKKENEVLFTEALEEYPFYILEREINIISD